MQKTIILPFLLCRRHLLLSKQPAQRDDMDAIERHATGFREGCPGDWITKGAKSRYVKTFG